MSTTEPLIETRRWMLWWRRITDCLYRWTPRRTPRPLHYVDLLTGDHIVVRHSATYTVLTVSGRDYYFNRDGTFDGTGAYSCCDEYHEKRPRLVALSGRQPQGGPLR